MWYLVHIKKRWSFKFRVIVISYQHNIQHTIENNSKQCTLSKYCTLKGLIENSFLKYKSSLCTTVVSFCRWVEPGPGGAMFGWLRCWTQGILCWKTRCKFVSVAWVAHRNQNSTISWFQGLMSSLGWRINCSDFSRLLTSFSCKYWLWVCIAEIWKSQTYTEESVRCSELTELISWRL